MADNNRNAFSAPAREG